MLTEALRSLREAVESNDGIALSDDELLEMATLCATELRARLPEVAVRQGDLPESYMDAVRERQHIHEVCTQAEIHPEENA